MSTPTVQKRCSATRTGRGRVCRGTAYRGAGDAILAHLAERRGNVCATRIEAYQQLLNWENELWSVLSKQGPTAVHARIAHDVGQLARQRAVPSVRSAACGGSSSGSVVHASEVPSESSSDPEGAVSHTRATASLRERQVQLREQVGALVSECYDEAAIRRARWRAYGGGLPYAAVVAARATCALMRPRTAERAEGAREKVGPPLTEWQPAVPPGEVLDSQQVMHALRGTSPEGSRPSRSGTGARSSPPQSPMSPHSPRFAGHGGSRLLVATTVPPTGVRPMLTPSLAATRPGVQSAARFRSSSPRRKCLLNSPPRPSAEEQAAASGEGALAAWLWLQGPVRGGLVAAPHRSDASRHAAAVPPCRRPPQRAGAPPAAVPRPSSAPAAGRRPALPHRAAAGAYGAALGVPVAGRTRHWLRAMGLGGVAARARKRPFTLADDLDASLNLERPNLVPLGRARRSSADTADVAALQGLAPGVKVSGGRPASAADGDCEALLSPTAAAAARARGRWRARRAQRRSIGVSGAQSVAASSG
eukprot:TRINITY_DN35513_c0_g1_i1.p1 TRINITY_DN35513_c0_g1~~TRINITY_DN35513_c0_g1_i1.p1  ORF type:complete len:534 (+),score=35.84 TRINITY_DN35513_c0_g1_i1:71-1672(+)